MKTLLGKYIQMIGDSYVYQVKEVKENMLTIEDGHGKQYTVPSKDVSGVVKN